MKPNSKRKLKGLKKIRRKTVNSKINDKNHSKLISLDHKIKTLTK